MHFKFHILVVLLVAFVLVLSCSKSSTGPEEEHDHHFEAIGLIVVSGADTLVSISDGIVTGNLTVAKDSTLNNLEIYFLDDHGDFEVPDDEDWILDWEVSDPNLVVVSLMTNEDWKISVSGATAGTGQIRIKILHDGHADFVSNWIPLTVN